MSLQDSYRVIPDFFGIRNTILILFPNDMMFFFETVEQVQCDMQCDMGCNKDGVTKELHHSISSLFPSLTLIGSSKLPC